MVKTLVVFMAIVAVAAANASAENTTDNTEGKLTLVDLGLIQRKR